MNLKLQQQAVALTEQIMRTYYCERDIYSVLEYMAPNASWIGPGEHEKKYTLEEMREHFERGKDKIPSCEVSNADLRAVDLGEDICLVTGSATVRATPESKLLVETDQRVSFTYRLIDNVLKVVHMHISNPYGEMKDGEYFPHEMGTQSFEYLQRLVNEKTEVIDMIAGNITGGLKGSNDDDTFSYFYVNDGLPRMLSYTYDEFMEKTGGTAVGAVYPPDLPGALADCVRCFAEGPVYSTEYRMEKKDGSLIWVLDSGRKALNSEGVTKINSIITDITPLKHALFDLEVERERYRIALENITGSMCEYDFIKDLFTVYYQNFTESGTNIVKLDFSRFSELVGLGKCVHSEDGDRFFEACIGKIKGSQEFRTRFARPNEQWRWVQFSCSIICDNTGEPLRSIGLLKDVTKEKHENLILLEKAQRDGLTMLLNQTAIREAVQTFLTCGCSCKGRKSALLLVDLDRFKEVNDTNGHLYGNEVLIKTARILEEIAGDNGIVGRTGGDEFIVLIKTTDPTEISRLADDIVRRVHEIGVDVDFFTSCSVGIAYQLGEEESFSDFFNRADKALYIAKDNGRNRWAMAIGQ